MAAVVRPGSDGEAMVGSVLAGRYRIVQLLGAGGVGHIYLAEQLAAGGERSRIAVKLLRAEHRGSPAMVARFEREAVAAARVVHPNVLSVRDIVIHSEAHPFFAMELLVGLDLADTLAYARRLAPPRAVRIASALAAGLGAAHAAGVVHRDVKPENVFLVHAADGREPVKLLDFGFAWMRGDPAPEGLARRGRITARQTVVGTPEYMAPEQSMGAEAAPTADVYSLGIMLFEMLAGRAPFTGGSYAAVARLHIEMLPPSLREVTGALDPREAGGVSPALEAVVRSALEKDPLRRPPTMARFAEALAATPEARGSD